MPRPEQPLKIWLDTGGSPASVYRAAQLEIPIFFRILGGTPEHWGQYCHSYRDAWLKAGHSVDAGDLAVFVGDIRQLIDLKCFVSLCKFLAFRLEFARHPPDANPLLHGFYCHFKKSSSVMALFKNTPVLFPVDTAYDTARIGLVLSPQANILSTVVF